jgi:hypothetical protein
MMRILAAAVFMLWGGTSIGILASIFIAVLL